MRIVFCFFLLLIFSCKTEKVEIINEYKVISVKAGPNNQHIDSVGFRIILGKNVNIYEYRSLDKDRSYLHLFTKEINNDSVLKAPDFVCRLIDSHFFKFKNEQIKVYKYSYNLLDTADEEEDYYFSDKYGIIFSRSIAWLKTNTLYNQEELKPLQDSIIKNEFNFKQSIQPPPPPIIKVN